MEESNYLYIKLVYGDSLCVAASPADGATSSLLPSSGSSFSNINFHYDTLIIFTALLLLWWREVRR